MTTEATDLSGDQLWASMTADDATSAAADAAPASASTESVDTTTPPAAPATAAAPAVAAPVAPAIDPGSVQALLDGLRAQNAQLADSIKTIGGRVGSLQSRVEKGLPAQPSQAAVAKALKVPAKMEQLLKDFPEFADPIQDFVRENLGASNEPKLNAEELAASIHQRVAGEFNAELQRREVQRVERAFPGWLNTVKTPEFKAWKAAQPPEILALAASDLAEDAIAMLDHYKKSVPSVADIQARREVVAGASRTSKPSGTSSGVTKGEDQMTDAEFFSHYAKQVAKQRA